LCSSSDKHMASRIFAVSEHSYELLASNIFTDEKGIQKVWTPPQVPILNCVILFARGRSGLKCYVMFFRLYMNYILI
jgi:hypothetical protein